MCYFVLVYVRNPACCPDALCCGGRDSLAEEFPSVDLSRYVGFYETRTWAVKNGHPVTEKVDRPFTCTMRTCLIAYNACLLLRILNFS